MQVVANNVKLIDVTPEMAAELLERNTNNRPVRVANLESLTRDMIEGRYQFNGDAVRIDNNDVLLDGQHRLLAVVASGTTQKMLIVSDLPPEAMKTIDSGVKRSTGDRLAMSGYKAGNNISAVLNVMLGLAHGAEKRQLTSTETYDALDRHADVEASIAVTWGCPIVGKSYLAAVHYIATYTGYADMANEFVEIFKTGHSANPNHPARVARERLIRMKEGGRSVARGEQLEILTAAWEHMRQGKSVSRIMARNGESRLRIHGWSVEQFWGYAKK